MTWESLFVPYGAVCCGSRIEKFLNNLLFYGSSYVFLLSFAKNRTTDFLGRLAVFSFHWIRISSRYSCQFSSCSRQLFPVINGWWCSEFPSNWWNLFSQLLEALLCLRYLCASKCYHISLLFSVHNLEKFRYFNEKWCVRDSNLGLLWRSRMLSQMSCFRWIMNIFVLNLKQNNLWRLVLVTGVHK